GEVAGHRKSGRRLLCLEGRPGERRGDRECHRRRGGRGDAAPRPDAGGLRGDGRRRHDRRLEKTGQTGNLEAGRIDRRLHHRERAEDAGSGGAGGRRAVAYSAEPDELSGNVENFSKGERKPMIKVRIPTPLRRLTGGQGEVTGEGETISMLIDALDKTYPGLKERLCDEQGELRRFVNIYVNEEDTRFHQGIKTAVK